MKPPKPAAHDADCPWCGAHHDLASHVSLTPQDKLKPEPGNVSLCAACGSLAVYGRDLRLRRPNKIEKWQIDRNPLVMVAVKAWISAKGERRQ